MDSSDIQNILLLSNLSITECLHVLRVFHDKTTVNDPTLEV